MPLSSFNSPKYLMASLAIRRASLKSPIIIKKREKRLRLVAINDLSFKFRLIKSDSRVRSILRFRLLVRHAYASSKSEIILSLLCSGAGFFAKVKVIFKKQMALIRDITKNVAFIKLFIIN